jgi:hypothetical protein
MQRQYTIPVSMNRGSALMRGVVSFGPFRLFPHGLLGQAESDHVCNVSAQLTAHSK